MEWGHTFPKRNIRLSIFSNYVREMRNGMLDLFAVYSPVLLMIAIVFGTILLYLIPCNVGSFWEFFHIFRLEKGIKVIG